MASLLHPSPAVSALRSLGFHRYATRAAIPLNALPSPASASATAVSTAASPASRRGLDYDTVADKATSTFTPVPSHVQAGNETTDTLPGGLVSATPVELQARTVRIFKEAKPATQSGDWHSHHWRMEWEVLSKGHRWENPLMGWQSSADMMQGTHIKFKSKEDAIAFAEKQGYEFFVQEPNTRRFTPKMYANNFLYSSKTLKHIRTK